MAAFLCKGTEVVNVRLDPTSDHQVMVALRDGKKAAFLAGDEPSVVIANDPDLVNRLFDLLPFALNPWEEGGDPPGTLDDGWVDLLQVACESFGLHPTVADVSGPMVGAQIEL